jgi:transcriptional regulator NrdR family protein
MSMLAVKQTKRERGTVSYPCPKCHGFTRVKETRRVAGNLPIKRTRVCKNRRCGHIFETRELAM